MRFDGFPWSASVRFQVSEAGTDREEYFEVRVDGDGKGKSDAKQENEDCVRMIGGPF